MEFLDEALLELAALNEDTFDLSPEGLDKLDDFISDDDITAFSVELGDEMPKDEEQDTVEVIDAEADSEEDIADSYLGKLVINCNVCHSPMYVNPEDVEVDEETQEVVCDCECPVCFSNEGFTLIGQVVPFVEAETKVEIDGEEVEVKEEQPEEEEEVIEEQAEVCPECGKAPCECEKVEEDLFGFDHTDKILDTVGGVVNNVVGGLFGEGCSTKESLGFHKEVGRRWAKYYDKCSQQESDFDDFGAPGDWIDLNGYGHEYKVVGYGKAKRQYQDKLSEDGLDQVIFLHEVDADEIFPATIIGGRIYDISDDIVGKLDECADQPMKEGKLSDALKRARARVLGSAKDEALLNLNLDASDLGRDSAVSVLGGTADNKKNEAAEEDEVADRFRRHRRLARKNESFEEVTIKTEDQEMHMSQDEEDGEVTVTSKPRQPEEEETREMIAPVEDVAEIETEEEIEEVPEEEEIPEEEEEITADEFDEEAFDDLGEQYLKYKYPGVVSYKTNNVYEAGKNQMVVEGVITRKSGRTVPTKFNLTAERLDGNNGLVIMCEHKDNRFTITTKPVKEHKIICESLETK